MAYARISGLRQLLPGYAKHYQSMHCKHSNRLLQKQMESLAPPLQTAIIMV